MKLEEQKHIQGTSREDEEKRLKETLDVIHANMDSYGRQVKEMKADIDEMLAHYHDNDPEVYVILTNTITLHDHMKRALERNERAADKPYFGRICFRDEASGKEESLYIGRGGISRDTTHQEVIDWRAPVAGAYYENGLGECSYPSPDGSPIRINLQLKRTYEIEQGKLQDFFDSEVISNDDLLTKYLARNKQAVLGEIVATIQKEQNEIIRRSPHHNVIVQGVAGSGKTTVAMHRISFILYNYAERFRPDDFYIVGSNRILLNYITSVLPGLDVHGVRQMTMEQLFVRLLYEDWENGNKYRIRQSTPDADAGKLKGTDGWFQALKQFCDKLEWDIISRESIYLNPRQFVEGIEDGCSGVYDRSTGEEALTLLVDGQAVERYIIQNPAVSIQSKINMLNLRLLTRIKDEFLGKGIKYTEAERKAILKAYRNRYGGKVWKLSTYQLYDDFLREQLALGAGVECPDREFDVYDLAALAYIYKRTKETEVISEAHHIVIDEAQDFGMMIYDCLDFCIHDCTYTIMGDVSQNIRFGFGLNDWEDLKGLLLDKDPMSGFGVLKKSYRNTVEISHFATDILHHGSFASYPVEPIIRHGKPVTVELTREEELWQHVSHQCQKWQESRLPTIAIICRNREKADVAAAELGKHMEIMETDPEKAEFGNGIMVLPVEYTKGLEFDAVLILNPTREEYPVDDGHARLLYVAATRALHELCVLHTGNLTGLIADPIPGEATGEAAQGTASQGNTSQGTASRGMLCREAVSLGMDSLGMTSRETTPRGTAFREAASQGRKTVRQEKFRETAPQEAPLPDTASASPAPGKPAIPRNNREAAAAADTPSAVSAIVATYRNDKNMPPKATGRSGHNIALVSHGYGSNNNAISGTGNQHNERPRSMAMGNEPGKLQTEPHTKGAAVGNSAPDAAKNHAFPDFGDFPPTGQLRAPGHPRIDLSVRWVTKQPDGLYLQSRYGILRLSPVGSGILRVTFAKGGKLLEDTHPRIKVKRLEKFWLYKESGQMVTLSTDELLLQADKATGAIRYLDRNKKLLLAERGRECRQQEAFPGGGMQSWLFLEPAKGEQLFAVGPSDRKTLPLRGTAQYISNSGELPFLFSDQGYGILIASDSPVIFCDLPSYGAYLHTEAEAQMDYYFIAGKKTDTLASARRFLLGEL